MGRTIDEVGRPGSITAGGPSQTSAGRYIDRWIGERQENAPIRTLPVRTEASVSGTTYRGFSCSFQSQKYRPREHRLVAVRSNNSERFLNLNHSKIFFIILFVTQAEIQRTFSVKSMWVFFALVGRSSCNMCEFVDESATELPDIKQHRSMRRGKNIFTEMERVLSSLHFENFEQLSEALKSGWDNRMEAAKQIALPEFRNATEDFDALIRVFELEPELRGRVRIAPPRGATPL